MRLLPLVRAELTRLTATTMSKIALVALILVPVLYGGLYLWANQDPYSSLNRVPAALVVADQGATVDGKPMNYGSDVAKDVLKDASFDWHEVSADEARTGLENSTYDFTLTIPAGFSDALASTSGADPQQARVIMATDDTNSYLATTIAQQAGARITKSVASRVGTEAAGKLLLGLADVRSALGDAAAGSSQLVDGLATARSGADTLADGNRKLATGADRVASGASTLSKGASDLSNGASALTPGAQQVATGARQVADGNRQIAALGSTAATDADTLARQVPAIRADIQKRMVAAGIPQSEISAALARLDAVGAGITQATAKTDGLNAKLQQLADGSEKVAQGSAQVADGAAKLQTGSAALAQGAGTLASGSGQVSTGAHSAADGATSLATGVGSLQDGATKLRDGLDSGLTQIPASTDSTRDAQANTIGDPVALRQDAVTQAGEYGAGLAPFFISLAAWIGIYALFLIVKPLSRRAITARKAPLRVTLAGWLTPAILGIVQMAGLYAIVAGALGFHIANPLAMYGTMVLASVTFAAIILALNVWLGSVGQFLGLVLMVVQLVTAGGTFPWQTLPEPLAALHQVLPMSFAVDALRQLMYGGDAAKAAADAGVLALWLVAGLLVALAGAMRITSHRTLRDLRPSLIG